MKTLKIGMLKIKDIIKLGTIVIIRENIKVLRIENVFQNIVYLNKFL